MRSKNWSTEEKEVLAEFCQNHADTLFMAFEGAAGDRIRKEALWREATDR